MALLAERAHDKGLVFYETMYGLRQSVLNLFAVGLFHRLEQELADLCRDGAFMVDRLDGLRPFGGGRVVSHYIST